MYIKLKKQQQKNKECMRKRDNNDEMLAEYDFSAGKRGKYAKRYEKGSNVVIIDKDVAKYFPDNDSVNEALRTLISLVKKPAGRHLGISHRMVSIG